MENQPQENLEKLPELVFEYSPETEFQRVKNVFSPDKRSFYQERKYRVDLPQGFSLDDDNELDEVALLEQIKREFDPEVGQKAETEIKENWIDIIKKLRGVFDQTGYNLPKKYTLKFSCYGVGGSYNDLDNWIILNIKRKEDIVGRKRTIIHEAIHISIEKLIKKYQIEHWVKERIVDLLVQKADPEAQTQKLPIDVTQIDQIFDQNYPNVEKILEEISKNYQK